MDVSTYTTPPTVTTPKAPAPEAAKDAATSRSKISADFDTFLKMLTAQISNQDPMNPMNAEEFAVQLATFSNVEQQVRTNGLLEKMLGASSDELTGISSWIGRDVRAQMPVAFDGRPVTVDPEPPVAGSTHQLVVRDASGAEMHREATDATGAPVVWNGRLAGGGTAMPGLYSFSVESFEKGELVATEPATTYGRVVEVRQSPEGPTLAFAGGVEIPAGDVTAVRESAL